MSRRGKAGAGGAAIAALGAVAWWAFPGAADDLAATAVAPRPVEPAVGMAAELWTLRRLDQHGVLDGFVARCRERAEAASDDAAAWRLLAEALLERCVHRDRRRGMAVGEPPYTELPPGHAEDIEAGLAAADRAIALGDPTGDAWRIRSALGSLRITGLGSYLQHRPAAKEALAKAASIDPANPRVLQARAMEQLLTPPWLGHDPASAAVTLERVAAALPDDERPLVSLAFARHLCGDRDAALAALDRALEQNPAHAYARAVRARLAAGEAEPFARPVAD